MKRLTLFLFISYFLFSSLAAQTPWAKKAAGAVFTLKTFDKGGQLLASSNGFFVSEQGEALSCFAPFKGAHRAVVIDAQGKEWPVDCIVGANDMYDVAKIRVSIKKAVALPMQKEQLSTGASAWLLPYSAKKVPQCVQGKVSVAETFQGDYSYYTIDMAFNEQHIGCPVLNDNGLVVGILQPAADSKATVCYAVSAPFANDMQISGMNFSDAALRSTAIAKAVPADQQQALLAMLMAGSMMDSLQYADYINRFIAQFPQAPDGYIYRARQLAAASRCSEADQDMQQAMKVAQQKDDVCYQYAQLIYQKVLLQPEPAYAPWTLERALQESRQAWQFNAMPGYLLQQAQIHYAMKQYQEAFDIYQRLTQGEMRNAENFYAAAQCKLQLQEQEAALAQLDSAVALFSQPYTKTAAPYLLARAQVLDNGGKYRQAVNDYNEYEKLMSAQLSAEFYYTRHQAEVKGHLYQQALNDIGRAIELAPADPLYYAEKASLELRVGMRDEAIETAQACIRIAPDMSDGYLFLGIAQCMKGMKAEGVKNMQKAKELGHEQAQALIEKYGK